MEKRPSDLMNGIVKRIMELMEEEGITEGEAKQIPKLLERSIYANKKRLEDNKPFSLYKVNQ